MKTLLMAVITAGTVLAQQGFDFSSLDKLGEKAKNKTALTLDANTIKMAAGFLGGESKAPQSAEINRTLSKLKALTVRSYEFDAEGQYNPADLAPLRSWLAGQPGWNKIVDEQEKNESSQVYVQSGADGNLNGIAVIALEKKEVTVVFINGSISMADVGKIMNHNLDLGLSALSNIGQTPAKEKNKSK